MYTGIIVIAIAIIVTDCRESSQTRCNPSLSLSTLKRVASSATMPTIVTSGSRGNGIGSKLTKLNRSASGSTSSDCSFSICEKVKQSTLISERWSRVYWTSVYWTSIVWIICLIICLISADSCFCTKHIEWFFLKILHFAFYTTYTLSITHAHMFSKDITFWFLYYIQTFYKAWLSS